MQRNDESSVSKRQINMNHWVQCVHISVVCVCVCAVRWIYFTKLNIIFDHLSFTSLETISYSLGGWERILGLCVCAKQIQFSARANIYLFFFRNKLYLPTYWMLFNVVAFIKFILLKTNAISIFFRCYLFGFGHLFFFPDLNLMERMRWDYDR